ncbi:nucleotidyltransferase domain-containing protein [Streptomyces lydicus]|uniref:nucleotidyltransferase domain-containing protein n=1 Tax=Streptomyces lydicus TaxID=47763 RepID=UPI003796B372
MTDDETTLQLLDRFVSAVRSLPSVRAVWAHGSLAGGDYQPGRSDLDLIAVLDHRYPAAEESRVAGLHEDLARAVPLAAKLHCSYAAVDEWGDPAQDHLTWAHEELMCRPVSPVTRRELHEFGKVLHGPPPAGLVPPVTDRQLAAYVIDDLRTFWRPALQHQERWLLDAWVDLGLLTLARASVTLRTGRLITKAAALDVLAELHAPTEVVEDIRRRRYGPAVPASPEWLEQRARLTRAFLSTALDEV